MSEFDTHECENLPPGVQVARAESDFESFAWQLIITRVADEADLEENHHLEQVGDVIWSTVVEINHCPYCGAKLRDEKLKGLEFAHFDHRGWSLERM